jgi:hypothetical protein
MTGTILRRHGLAIKNRAEGVPLRRRASNIAPPNSDLANCQFPRYASESDAVAHHQYVQEERTMPSFATH